VNNDSTTRKIIVGSKATVPDLIQYQTTLNRYNENMTEFDLNTQFGIDAYYEQISLAPNLSAECTIPKSKFRSYLKPYWNKDVKSAHAIALTKRRVWINENKPTGQQHPSFKEYKYAKLNFRKAHEQAYQTYI